MYQANSVNNMSGQGLEKVLQFFHSALISVDCCYITKQICPPLKPPSPPPPPLTFQQLGTFLSPLHSMSFSCICVWLWESSTCAMLVCVYGSVTPKHVVVPLAALGCSGTQAATGLLQSDDASAPADDIWDSMSGRRKNVTRTCFIVNAHSLI